MDFDKDLTKLIKSFESSEIPCILKENFIITLKESLSFEDDYREKSKKIYFNKFENHINKLTKCIKAQKEISELGLNELYYITHYLDRKSIIETLEWSIEYIINSYIEINLKDNTVVRQAIQKDKELDLQKIDNFLSKYSELYE